MNKRIVNLLLAVSLIMSTAVPTVTTYAEPSFEETLAQSITDVARTKVKEAEDKINEINIDLQKLDQQISDQEIKKQETTTNIQNTENDIKQTEEDIKTKQQEVEETQKAFEERMKALYKRGGQNVVEILLDSKSLGELIAKIEGAKKIAQHDKQLVADLEAQKQGLKDKSAELATKKQELVSLKEQQQVAIDEATAQKANRKPLLEKAQVEKIALQALLNSSESIYMQIKGEREAVEAAEAARIAEEEEAAAARALALQNNNVISRGSGNGQAIADTATSFVFKDSNVFPYSPIYYVWGGTTTAGFDCSGFVQYVYRQCGYSIGRSTYNQIGNGSYVEPSIDSLQPGDLVFFGSASSPYHVGIYVGGGQYVHSPTEGQAISYDSLGRRSDFSAARRIVG